MKAVTVAVAVAVTAAVLSSAAGAGNSKYLKVEGAEALREHSINQMADESNPPQGYLVTLPSGYTLTATDVTSDGNAICGVSAYDYKTQTVRLDGFDIETDSGSCVITLTIYNSKTKREVKVPYTISQVGT